MPRIILLVLFLFGIYYLYQRWQLSRNYSVAGEEESRYPLASIIHDVSRPQTGEIYKKQSGGFEIDLSLLSQIDLRNTFLLDQGYKGDATSWDGVMYGALRLADPAIVFQCKRIEESDSLLYWSESRQTLESIGRLAYEIMLNETAFLESIQAAEFDDKMV